MSDVPMSPRSRLDSFRKEQEKAAAAAIPSAGPLDSSRSRLDSFRASRGMEPAGAPAAGSGQSAAPSSYREQSSGSFSLNMPGSSSGDELPIPALSLGSIGSGGPGPLSSRRLKKEVLKASSTSSETSNTHGSITLRDGSGTPRSVRVVQSEEFEDFNMVAVKWVYTLDEKFHEVVLRHGRRSGIRKIYVNKELIERHKSISGYLVDRGSQHHFTVRGRPATITIERGRSAGFTYSLSIDNEEIERDIGITGAGLSAEMGTHFVRPCVGGEGFGMTLANCGQRTDGVVVLELEPGFPAHRAGLLVGDIILSVGEECIVDTNVIIDKLTDVQGEVILEVAGNSPSRIVTIPNPHASKEHGALTLSDTACGVGVYVSAVTHARPPASTGHGQLEIGDVILSVDGAVTESAKETMKYIARAPDPLTFVVAGRDLAVMGMPGTGLPPPPGAGMDGAGIYPDGGA